MKLDKSIIKKKHERLLSNLISLLNSEMLKEKFRTEPRKFIRNRLFTFGTILYIQINAIKKSLSVSVSNFLKFFHFSGEVQDGSKQGYSQARTHIKWEVFEYLNDNMMQDYYSDKNYICFKDKYLLLASDGTNYQLPYEPELVKEFGESNNGQGQPMCMAQSVKIYDVLNKLNVKTVLGPYNSGIGKAPSEQALFEKCLEKIEDIIDTQKHEIILLGDKYYPSFYYMHVLPKSGYNYVFRCTAKFCKEVKAFAQRTDDVNDIFLDLDMLKYDRKRTSLSRIECTDSRPSNIRVRCVKFKVANGEYMFLLTNIENEKLTYEDLKNVYHFRWEEETSFDTNKNIMEVENLSSKKVNGVYQDFFATGLTENIAQLLICQAQEELDEEQAKKNNKHEYQINRTVAIGFIKDELPGLFLGKESVSSWYKRMTQKIKKYREPVRPGRSYARKKKHKLKYPMNRKRVT